ASEPQTAEPPAKARASRFTARGGRHPRPLHGVGLHPRRGDGRRVPSHRYRAGPGLLRAEPPGDSGPRSALILRGTIFAPATQAQTQDASGEVSVLRSRAWGSFAILPALPGEIRLAAAGVDDGRGFEGHELRLRRSFHHIFP